MASSFRLDRRGVQEYLTTSRELAAAINRATHDVADHVRATVGDDVEVEVSTYTTDRRAGSVTIADSRGAHLQATTGALTRAAAAVGLEVRSR